MHARTLRTGIALLAFAVAPSATADELLVAAAASLRDALEPIEASFRAERGDAAQLRVAFGASRVLAQQLRAGAPFDVLITADDRVASALAAEGLLASEPVRIAGNRLVVLATPAAAGGLARPQDLAGRVIRRLAVADETAPVGRYAREWLEHHGLFAALADRLVRTGHARATLSAVDEEHVDAAIVYETDARAAQRARRAFEIPSGEQPRIVYAAAATRGARPGADAFVAHLLGPDARRAFEAAGFTAP